MSEDEIAEVCAGSEAKLAQLRAGIGRHASVLVAFSGGVDSSFLLAVAHEVLGERCTGLLALSPSIPERERSEARAFAERLGVTLVAEEARELDDPNYRANPVNRCYYCKSELFSLCERKRAELGIEVVFDGSNAEDRAEGDWRPGRKAACERKVCSPLADAGLTKREIRAWSQRLGLPTWDKPQMACLASRLPYGTEVTAERLAQIGAAEQDLRDLGLRQFRVRYHGAIARLEVAAEEQGKLLDPALRTRIAQALKGRGFTFAVLDLEPFRTGRMNEAAGLAKGPARA